MVLEEKQRISYDVSLADYSTWKIGGVARCLYHPASIAELQAFLPTLPLEEEVFFLGLGSNTLVRSGGLDATVILMQGNAEPCQYLPKHLIYVDARMAGAQLARHTMRQKLKGLEFLAGIPGTVGGALAMNAGCHGYQTWDLVVSVRMINRKGELITRTPEDFRVYYREVVSPPDEWFVGATFQLSRGTVEGSKVLIDHFLDHRKQTQPIHLPNGGCVFRNPPLFPAGKIIEQCGFKGCTHEGATVSPMHANFIVHHGDTTPEAVEALINKIEGTVLRQTGVRLCREVKIVGREAAL